MNMFTRRKSALISVFIAAALAIAVACGGDDAPVAAPKAPATAAPAATAMMAATAVPAATAMPAATAAMAATAMPAATAVPAPTAMPAAPTATAPAMMQGPANPERYGGNLTVSLGAAISTLDVHRTTGTTANTIAYAVQEFLFAYNEQLQAQPLLIDRWETSSDGLTWTSHNRGTAFGT